LISDSKIIIKEEKTSRLRLYLSIGIVCIWLIIGFFFFQDVGGFIEWFEELGPLSSVIYCLMISLAIVMVLPTPILKVGSGALFPYWLAVLVNFIASLIGGLIAFLLGRWLFRDYISQIVASDERLVKLESAINEEAMQISVLVRLSPLLPDELLNYVMSSSPVSIRVFFLSNLSSIVYSLAYAYFGLAAGKLVFSGEGMDGFAKSPAGTVLLIIGVIASILVTMLIARMTKKAVNNRVESD
tara:strand:- start:297 stop:1022 length:726 start_codon:yes stop_codon:yes gene_type:complete